MASLALAVAPTDHRLAAGAQATVRSSGAELVDPARARGLVWVDPAGAGDLAALVAEHPHIEWVQLPFAGVEPFADAGVFDHERVWTCGKGVYAEPVAEHVMALALAGLRHLVGYARAETWSAPLGRNLLGARVLILGGGGITESLIRLLGPFGCEVTVLRRSAQPLDGARVGVISELTDHLPGADVVVLALALTPETVGIIGARELELMAPHAWLINVARGRHVDTDALVAALAAGSIGGAALDVTDPEPLPAGHPLWSEPRCVITPHVANTPEMGEPLLMARIAENIERFATGRELLGRVDPNRGY